MNKVVDVKKINKMRCIAGLVCCIIMILLSTTSLVINLINAFKLGADMGNFGLKTFKMFTTLSNLIVAIAAWLCIPYQIEGLRKNNYHLPRWIVLTLYTGTTGVGVTFVTALTAISAVQGFQQAMLNYTNLFLHTINPIFAMLLFTVINDDHTVYFKHSFISLIPLTIYAIIYMILVFIIGNWADHYSMGKFVPWPVALIIMMSLGFGVSNGLRVLHNLVHKKHKQAYINYYQNSPDIKSDTIEEAIIKLAKLNKKDYKGGDITIPRRSIRMMIPAYKTDKTIEELYKLYIDNFLID